MCGRYTIFTPTDIIKQHFQLEEAPTYAPNYNASPTHKLPVILNYSPKKLSLEKWGMETAWTAKLGKKDGLINVRMETLRDKHTFTKNLLERRCIIPSDGFYEWQKSGKIKIPYRISLKKNTVFGFAGLWESISTDTGIEKIGYAIITTTPNIVVEPIHKRMPVILPLGSESEWLNPILTRENLMEMLIPYQSEGLMAYEVNRSVNNARNNSEELINKIS